MNMEHRWGSRTLLDVSITINYRPVGLLRGRIQNISRGGAFISTKTRLALNSRVELVMAANHDGATRIHRIEAVVLRLEPSGAGIMFTHFNPRELGKLMTSLRSASRSRALVPIAEPVASTGDKKRLPVNMARATTIIEENASEHR